MSCQLLKSTKFLFHNPNVLPDCDNDTFFVDNNDQLTQYQLKLTRNNVSNSHIFKCAQRNILLIKIALLVCVCYVTIQRKLFLSVCPRISPLTN